MDEPSTSAAGLQRSLAQDIVPSSVIDGSAWTAASQVMDIAMDQLARGPASGGTHDLIDPEARRITGLVYDLRMMLHASLDYMRDNGDIVDLFDEPPIGVGRSYAHPEKPDRISTIHSLLKQHGLVQRMVPLECPEVLKEDAMLVHSEALWDTMQATARGSLARA